MVWALMSLSSCSIIINPSTMAVSSLSVQYTQYGVLGRLPVNGNVLPNW